MEQRTYPCALITGASSGLGREFAMQLAPHVDHLVLVARRDYLLQELQEALEGELPDLKVTAFTVNLEDEQAIEELVGLLKSKNIEIDLLVNNAGLGDYGEFLAGDWSKQRAMLRVNIEALTRLCRALLPDMATRGRGGVINVSSLAGDMPMPDFAVYAASKAYVTSFSEALRVEVAGYGINVLTVCPGPVKTGFGETAARDEEERKRPLRAQFYLPKQRVVAEALNALWRRRARVYPGLRTTLAACAIGLVPIFALREIMKRMRLR